MTTTDWILWSVIAFGDGYGFARFAKNIGELARRWGFFYLLATLAMVVSLEVGARVRGEALAYWGVPWVVVAVWGWIPPLVAGGAGMLGSGTERRRVRSAVRRRRRRAAEIDGV